MGRWKFVNVSEAQECAHCDEVFDDRMELRAHVSDMHSNVIQCEYLACAYQAIKRSEMERHNRKLHEENAVACSIIGCDFVVGYDYMKRHVKAYHPNELNRTVNIKREASLETCNDDEQSSSNEMDQDEPVKEQPTISQLPCPSCPKMFWDRSKLNRHVARVHEKRYKETVREKKYACTYEGCGKAYTTPGKLRDHETSHTGETPFECGRCDKKFGSRELFGKHLRQYHAISIKDVTKMLNT